MCRNLHAVCGQQCRLTPHGLTTKHRTAAGWADGHAGDKGVRLYEAKLVAAQGRPASAMAEEGVPEGEQSKGAWDAARLVMLQPDMLASHLPSLIKLNWCCKNVGTSLIALWCWKLDHLTK